MICPPSERCCSLWASGKVGGSPLVWLSHRDLAPAWRVLCLLGSDTSTHRLRPQGLLSCPQLRMPPACPRFWSKVRRASPKLPAHPASPPCPLALPSAPPGCTAPSPPVSSSPSSCLFSVHLLSSRSCLYFSPLLSAPPPLAHPPFLPFPGDLISEVDSTQSDNIY